MSKLMLIDASHPEETRVAVVSDGQIEDFDFEARDRRQLRGNIYLAKVTRVEPSLQAAFVEYGGNRHGFLAFSEIHPDYYQIPKEDRDALMAEAAREEEAERNRGSEFSDSSSGDDEEIGAEVEGDAGEVLEAEIDLAADDEADDGEDTQDPNADEIASDAETGARSARGRKGADRAAAEDDGEGHDAHDAADEDDRMARRHALAFQRKYKIQEVIRRRQVMLIQVVKEERGNKGAAVTTYLSLAGRYCVLMPNTGRGGGISRKITNSADRKRLKKITSEFNIPRGAGLIVRTAGAKRTRSEIRRDFEYLTKLWEQIVSKTLDSMAPCLIHEEGHLVLRAVRDLYDKDVSRIVVEGDEAYQEARNFVAMLMPNHVRKVRNHDGAPPLFVATGVEEQLESIFSPVVQLPSGGYIVINQTEALVAIDVNSGKATRERNVESTALKTNLEAATEACRQMRLRDLAGLVVIDFIDMEDGKNIRAIERRMKDALKIDRARVQTGRISQFGLFEISRQRRRAGVLELSSEPCRHCAGTGRVRGVESAALQLLRTIEARATDDRVDTLTVQAPPEVALYILNEKRVSIAQIESDCHAMVRIEANASLKPGEFVVDATGDGEVIPARPFKPVDLARLLPPIDVDDDEEEADDDDDLDLVAEDDAADDDHDDRGAIAFGPDEVDDDADEDDHDERPDREDGLRAESEASRRRRRGRRGGRRRGRREDGSVETTARDDDREAIVQPTRQERDDRDEARRGRGRRRRGNDRGNRPNRAPDIAVDGGEMLDAIASAPFLISHEETAAIQTSGTDAVVAEPTVDAPMLESASAPEWRPAAAPSAEMNAEDRSREPYSETVDAVVPEQGLFPADSIVAPNQAATPAAAIVETEPELHPIHGAPTDLSDKKPERKRGGWWNRKRAG